MEDEIEEMESRPPSSRRNFSLRNNAARQVAINFMPSRNLPGNTIRIRRSASGRDAVLEEAAEDGAPGAPECAERCADHIVRELEQHQRLMEDNPEAEEMRREALRDLPQGLTMKRHVRAKLSASVSLRSKGRPLSCYKRLKYRMSFAWKRTRDRFRDLAFSVELWYEAIRAIEGHFGSAVGSYFHFLRWLFALDVALAGMLVAFVVVPQALHDEARNGTVEWGLLDFVSGQGGFADSLLFYGHYHSGEVSARGPLHYSMPFAYFFTMLALYLLFFALLCYRTALSYRRNFIETARRGGLRHRHAGRLFCGWDFGVTTPRAQQLHAKSIYNEFKELLNEQTKNTAPKSLCTKIGQRLANVVVTAFVLGAIVGLEYGLLLLLRREGRGLLLSAAVAAAVAACPALFALVARLEYYKPRTALYVTLARTCCLDIGTLTLLLYYWANSDVDCWETAFGQEAYRLVLLDAVISLLVLPAIEFVRAFLFKLYPKSTPPEFNIAYNSLTIIYNQAVLWFGMLFSPLLAVAVALKFLLLFYVKRECALRACQPARKIWRAAQTQTVLYMLVTLSLFTTLFGIGTLFLGTSSQSCGPFKEYETVFAVLTEGALRLSRGGAARAALAFATRPGVIGFLALALWYTHKEYETVFAVLTEGALRLSRGGAARAALAFATRPGVIGFLALALWYTHKEYETVFAVLTEGALRLSRGGAARAALAFATRPGVIGFLALALWYTHKEYETVFAVLTEGALRLSRGGAARAALAFATRPGVIGFLALALWYTHKEYETVFAVLTEGALRLSRGGAARAALAFATRPGVIGFLALALWYTHKEYETVFPVLTEGALRLSWGGAARAALAFATRPGVIGFLALALCVWVHYMRARARAQHAMAAILRRMLLLQAKDKDFLLNAIAKVSNGEWMYSPKSEEQANSHTWKYLNEVRKPSNSDYHFDASRLSHSLLDRSARSRPNSYQPEMSRSRSNDGDTDSSFSWQGSSSCLNKGEGGDKKWI